METTPVEAPDWPAQVTDRIIGVVDQVRVKTTDQAITVARGLVFGTVVAILAVVIITLVLVGSFRMLDGYLPVPTWSVYLILGGIVTLIGVALWMMRRPRAA